MKRYQCDVIGVLIGLALAFGGTGLAAETPAPPEPETDMAKTEEPAGDESFFDMSLEELMEIPVTSTSLTAVASRRVSPSTVFTITQKDIQRSGARSLYELLEVYVPNVQIILHSAKLRHIGLRGIISNRDDKYLLLVNGRIMNDRTDFGVQSERDLPMLRDIRQIDVVRGPGSALYGPGALAMVINITTDDARTFKGFEVSQRVGAIEEHYTSEFKYGHELNDGAGLFLYGGVSKYPGAPAQHSPVIYGGGPTTRRGVTYDWDDEVETDNRGWNEAYGGNPKVKLHGQYTKGNVDAWLRYTQGGEYIDTSGAAKHIDTLFGQGYRQGTAAFTYRQEVADALSIKYMVSYDRFESVSEPNLASRFMSYREDEYFGKIIANWRINEDHELAFGGEWSHMELGLNPWGEDTAMQSAMGGYTNPMPRWHTDMFSLLAEYQWRINDQVTTFVSARQDDHTFTDQMFSPRFALVYMPTDVDTLRLMASRSVRTNTEGYMKLADLRGSPYSPAEVLKAYEVRYERKLGKRLWLAADVFLHDQDMISWVSGQNRTGRTGTEKLWGVEMEASYVRDRFRFDLSHGYTKLIDFELVPGVTSSEDTAAPMGFGNDLANWYNNISKMRLHLQMDDKWALDSSLVVYWDSPGGEDYADYRRAVAGSARYDPRADDTFYHNWYLNLGLQCQHSKNLSVRLDAYNILGLFDESLNKRRIGFNTDKPAQVRIQPPALQLQAVYKF